MPEEAFAERQTRLDGFRDGRRNHDLVVVGMTTGRKTVLCIEGKADEPFDVTLATRVARAKKKRGSNATERVRLLAEGILGTADLGKVGHLRYQLVQATTATLIEAGVRGVAQAVLIVHEFRTRGLDPDKLKRNAADCSNFLRSLPPDEPKMQAPKQVRGLASGLLSR